MIEMADADVAWATVAPLNVRSRRERNAMLR
jgi:hypothetical protein